MLATMPLHATGDIAKLCDVSVRTVQFYDTKGLLVPSELSDGGRRLYTDDDVTRLRLICTLKALGLSLDSIKGILESEEPQKVLSVLLDEQMTRLSEEIKEREAQVDAITVVKEAIRTMTTIPITSILDMEMVRRNAQGLMKVRGTLLSVGLVMDVIEVGTIIWWIAKGAWIPFAVGMPFVILLAVLLVRMYYRNTEYVCPECGVRFRPAFRSFFSARHTPKTRKLTCTACGHTGYCVEVFAGSRPVRRGYAPTPRG